MKKSKLIKLLQELKGDPDIVLWNGMVGGWMDIKPKLVEGDLVTQTLEHFLESVRIEDCIDRKDWTYQLPEAEIAELTKLYKSRRQWEDNAFVTEDDIKERRYKRKRVVYIDAKQRGVSTWDRMGSIKY